MYMGWHSKERNCNRLRRAGMLIQGCDTCDDLLSVFSSLHILTSITFFIYFLPLAVAFEEGSTLAVNLFTKVARMQGLAIQNLCRRDNTWAAQLMKTSGKIYLLPRVMLRTSRAPISSTGRS
jgi:hypothetical protein